MVARRSFWTALTIAAICMSSCGAQQTQVRANDSPSQVGPKAGNQLESGPFHLVETELVYLNGAEGEGLPPLSFLLVGGDAVAGPQTERRIVETYVEAMRAEGWRFTPYDTDQDWWVFYGRRGSSTARVGPASRFVQLATADEGYARTKFRQKWASRGRRPLIVVSIDPQG